MKKPSGFSLLEMMIVLSIMATLSVFSAQAIQQAIRNKAKLQVQIDEVSQVRDSLKIIERDVNLAFHYTDLETELKEIVKKKRIEQSKSAQPGSPVPPPPPGSTPSQTAPPIASYNPEDPNDPLNQKSENRVDPSTHFIGHEDKMFFPTLNSSRLNEGSQQADFIKVGYVVESCRKPGESSTGKNCLIRKASNVVEGDITKIEDGVALLTDVTEFKLRYMGKGRQDWANDWDSVKGDAIAKGRFPDAVEISLTIEKGEGDKKKKISMQIVAPLRFTNNIRQDSLNQQAQQQIQSPFPGSSQQPNFQQNPGGNR